MIFKGNRDRATAGRAQPGSFTKLNVLTQFIPMDQPPKQPPNAFNVNEPQNPNVLNIPEQEVSSSSWVANAESGHTPASGKILKNLKRIYIILLVIGLIIGGVVSVGIVTVLNKLDSTDVPARVDEKWE